MFSISNLSRRSCAPTPSGSTSRAAHSRPGAILLGLVLLLAAPGTVAAGPSRSASAPIPARQTLILSVQPGLLADWSMSRGTRSALNWIGTRRTMVQAWTVVICLSLFIIAWRKK